MPSCITDVWMRACSCSASPTIAQNSRAWCDRRSTRRKRRSALVLRRAITPTDCRIAQGAVLGLATTHPRAPQAERTRLEMPAHQLDHARLIEAIQGLDGFKGRPVLPGHFDNARCVGS